MDIERQEVIKQIKLICQDHKVPLSEFNEQYSYPEGSQTPSDIFSLKWRIIDSVIGLETRYETLVYEPWIRVLPNRLTVEEFDEILKQGWQVRDCVAELNYYLKDKHIYSDRVKF